MNIHEFQAKEVFSRYGIPVPKGIVASTPEEAEAVTRELGFHIDNLLLSQLDPLIGALDQLLLRPLFDALAGLSEF